MKQLFLWIFAMFLFLANSTTAHGQWPKFDLNPTKDFVARVDDGFGGFWGFNYNGSNIMLLKHGSGTRTIEHNSSQEQYYDKVVKLNDMSMTPEAVISFAFYGYLTELHNKDAFMTAYLWISINTGEIDEVWFSIPYFKYSTNRKILLSVPPRNFTLLADLLKKTVKFDVPKDIIDSFNIYTYGKKEWNKFKKKYGNDVKLDDDIKIFYKLRIKFPAPTEGEPDFLAIPAEK